MSKRVRITLEVSEQFVRLLNANVQLSGLRDKDELDPAQQLSVVALAEMRGMVPDAVHAATLPAWRDSIQAVHDERRWRTDNDDTWQKTKG